ncbi:MAG: cyclic nucleotide-binding domain-containing protein [Actinobacteria bacterium]|nr:cyclic nucleotide-binding domain-containing protein [Actinomycetota bacterium]
MRLRKNAKLELLASIPLFSGCSRRELEQIGSIADETNVPEGRTLIEQNQPAHEFFALIDGTADVRRNGRKVSTMSGGDFFGEIALIAKTPRTATVTTSSPVRLLVITDRDFDRVLGEAPSIAVKILRELGARLAPESL